jgi:hypothetical protein
LTDDRTILAVNEPGPGLDTFVEVSGVRRCLQAEPVFNASHSAHCLLSIFFQHKNWQNIPSAQKMAVHGLHAKVWMLSTSVSALSVTQILSDPLRIPMVQSATFDLGLDNSLASTGVG